VHEDLSRHFKNIKHETRELELLKFVGIHDECVGPISRIRHFQLTLHNPHKQIQQNDACADPLEPLTLYEFTHATVPLSVKSTFGSGRHEQRFFQREALLSIRTLRVVHTDIR